MAASAKRAVPVALLLLVSASMGMAGEEPAFISSRKAVHQDVLSLRGGKFQLDGRPFAEISFNKFDLFWALYMELVAHRELTPDNPMVKAQERALSNLRKLGFRSVRVFAFPPVQNGGAYFADPANSRMIFEALDKMVRLCEEQGIGIVWSLGCHQFTDENEHLREVFANPESKNRKALYAYLAKVVDRYKGSPAVLMWEVGNELTLLADIGDEKRVFDGKRMPTLRNVADFYNDIAKFIKGRDPLRLVSNGGSNPRAAQWHLYQHKGWETDTYAEQAKCFDLLFDNSAIDVVDIHYYLDTKPGIGIAGENGRERLIGLSDYKEMAARSRKPLMVGELARSIIPPEDTAFWKENPGYFKAWWDTKTALPWVRKLLDEVVNSKVPLSYWWSYQSDRPCDQADVLSLERTPEIVAAIAEANKRLKTNY